MRPGRKDLFQGPAESSGKPGVQVEGTARESCCGARVSPTGAKLRWTRTKSHREGLKPGGRPSRWKERPRVHRRRGGGNHRVRGPRWYPDPWPRDRAATEPSLRQDVQGGQAWGGRWGARRGGQGWGSFGTRAGGRRAGWTGHQHSAQAYGQRGQGRLSPCPVSRPLGLGFLSCWDTGQRPRLGDGEGGWGRPRRGRKRGAWERGKGLPWGRGAAGDPSPGPARAPSPPTAVPAQRPGKLDAQTRKEGPGCPQEGCSQNMSKGRRMRKPASSGRDGSSSL